MGLISNDPFDDLERKKGDPFSGSSSSSPLFKTKDEALSSVQRSSDPMDLGQPKGIASPTAQIAQNAQSAPSSGERTYSAAFGFSGSSAAPSTPVPTAAPAKSGERTYSAAFGFSDQTASAPTPVEEKPATPKDDSDFGRRFVESTKQIVPLYQGVAGLVGDSGEKAFGKGGMFTALKDWGFDGFKKGMAEASKDQKSTDDVTVAWSEAKKGNLGALVDWAQGGLGYVAGQAVETVGMSVLGAVAGGAVGTAAGPVGTAGGAVGGAVAGAGAKAASRTFVKGMIEKAVQKEAAEIAAKQGVEAGSEAVVKQATKNVASRIGQNATLLADNFAKEAGGIYGEAREQAQKEGRELDGGDLARIWGTGALAALTETVSDRLGLDTVTGRLKLPGNGRVGRALIGGLIGGSAEAGTELVQTGLERLGAGQSLGNEEAIKDYINSGALGFLGGGSIAGVTGAIRGSEESSKTKTDKTTTPPPAAPSTGLGEGTSVDSIATETNPSNINIGADALAGRMGMQKWMNFVAAIYRNGTDEQKQTIDSYIDSTNSRDNFNDAMNNPDRVQDGDERFRLDQEDPSAYKQSEWFLESAKQALAQGSEESTSQNAPGSTQSAAPTPTPSENAGTQQSASGEAGSQFKGDGLVIAPKVGDKFGVTWRIPIPGISDQDESVKTPDRTYTLTKVEPQLDGTYNIEFMRPARGDQPEKTYNIKGITRSGRFGKGNESIARFKTVKVGKDPMTEFWRQQLAEKTFALQSEETQDKEAVAKQVEDIKKRLKYVDDYAAAVEARRKAEVAPKDDGLRMRTNREAPKLELTTEEINQKFEEARAKLGDSLRKFAPGVMNITPEDSPSGAQVLSELADYMYWLVRKGVRSAAEAIARTKASFGDSIKPVSAADIKKAYETAVARDQAERTKSNPLAQERGKPSTGTATKQTAELKKKLEEIDKQFGGNQKVAESKPKEVVSASDSYSTAKSKVIANPIRQNAVELRDAMQNQMQAEGLQMIKERGGPKNVTKADVAEIANQLQAKYEEEISGLPERVRDLFTQRLQDVEATVPVERKGEKTRFVKTKTKGPSAIERISADVLDSLLGVVNEKLAPVIKEEEDFRDTGQQAYKNEDRVEVLPVKKKSNKPVSKEVKEAAIKARERQIAAQDARNRTLKRKSGIPSDGRSLRQRAIDSIVAELNEKREKERTLTLREIRGALTAAFKAGDHLTNKNLFKAIANGDYPQNFRDRLTFPRLTSAEEVEGIFKKMLPELQSQKKEAPKSQIQERRELSDQEKRVNSFKSRLMRITGGANTSITKAYDKTVRAISEELQALQALSYSLRYNKELNAKELLEKVAEKKQMPLLKRALEGDETAFRMSGINLSVVNQPDALRSAIKELEERQRALVSNNSFARSAEVFQNWSEIYRQVQELRKEATGVLTEEEVSNLFDPAMEQMTWVTKEKQRLDKLGIDSNNFETMVAAMASGEERTRMAPAEFSEEETEGGVTGFELAKSIVSDFISKKTSLDDVQREVRMGIEQGEFTHEDVTRAYRELGQDPSVEHITSGAYIANQFTLKSYREKFAGTSNPVGTWLASLHNYLMEAGEAGKARYDSLSSSEKAIYNRYLSSRNALKGDKHLFLELSLSEVEDTKSIKDPVFRKAVEESFPDTDERVGMWMEQMFNLVHNGPQTLDDFIRNATLTKEEKARYQQWETKYLRSLAVKAVREARTIAVGRINQVPNVPAVLMQKYRVLVSAANENVARAIEREALRISEAVANLRETIKVEKKNLAEKSRLEQPKKGYRAVLEGADEQGFLVFKLDEKVYPTQAEAEAVENAVGAREVEIKSDKTLRDTYKEVIANLLKKMVRQAELTDRQRALALDEMLSLVEGKVGLKQMDFSPVDAIAETDAMAQQAAGRFTSVDALEQLSQDETGQVRQVNVNDDEEADFVESERDFTENANLSLENQEQADEELDEGEVDQAGQVIDDNLRARRGGFSGVVTAAHVMAKVEEIKADAGGNLPPIVVVGNIYQLPDGLRQRALAKTGLNGAAKGLFDTETGTTYIFSDFVSSDQDVEFTVFHEIFGHYGIRGVLGNKLDSFLNQMYNSNPRIRKMADALMESEKIGKLEATEEALADLAGLGSPAPLQTFLGKAAAFLRPFLPRVAAWLESKIDVRAIKEVAWILKQAKDYGRNGGTQVFNGVPSEIRLAEAPPPYEMVVRRGKEIVGYARYNPTMDDWYVFTNNGKDVRNNGYQTAIIDDLDQVQKILHAQGGKIEMRTRSAYYVNSKTPLDINTYGDYFDPNTSTGWRRFWRSATIQAQNEYLPIMERVKFLESKYGPLSDRENPLRAIMLYESRTGSVLKQLKRDHVDKITALLEVLGKQGGDVDMEFKDVTRTVHDWYLMALHAPERNAVVRRLRKQGMNEEQAQAAAGVEEKNPGSGISDKEAKEILAKIRQEMSPDAMKTLEALSARMQALSRDKVRYMYNTGLITADQAAALNQYKNYVPLKNSEVDVSQLPGGRKLNVRGTDIRRSTGRGNGNIADSVIENAILDAESVSIRGQKNVVLNTILNMLELYPDPNFASVNVIKFKTKVQKDGTTRETALFRQDGSINLIPMFQGKVREIPNYEVVTERDTNYINADNVVVAKVGGRPVTMEFADTSFGSFFNSIHGGFSIPTEDNLGAQIADVVSRATRLIGRMYTSFNPEWIPVNAMRDLQSSLLNAVTDGKITKEQVALMRENMRKAANAAAHFFYGEENKATWLRNRLKTPDAKMMAYLEEMEKEGGITLFLDRSNFEDVSRKIRMALTGPKNKLEGFVSSARDVLDYVEMMGTPLEVMPRLALYAALRETGVSPSEAALAAKDITVNFNMRGRARILRQLYVFWGPAINGTEKMYRLAKENKAKFSAVAGGLFVLGFVMNMIARANSPGGDDDDEPDALDKIPVYKRSTSIVIIPDMPGGSIPLPYGWNAFYAMGHHFADYVQGIQPMSTALGRGVSAFVEAFMPQGSGLEKDEWYKQLISVVSPSVLTPINDLAWNQNRYGAPIYREKGPFTPYDEADAYMHFDSVSPITRGLAHTLNDATGGDRYKDGFLGFNPAKAEYLVQAFSPGAVTTVYKLASTGVRSLAGEDIKRTPMPFVDKFSAYVPQGFNMAAYRRVSEKVETEWKRLTDPNISAEAKKEIREEFPQLGRMHAVYSATHQDLRKLSSAINAIEDNPKIPDAEKVRRKNELKARMEKVYDRFMSRAIESGFKEQAIGD